ncbi:DivIC [Sporolactobacillus shoreae]|uniref:DivIC n=1 Tax=Sporolactobacillus shoreae TaxID=1465501 RepID=A0A4Z0GIA3_9BACL|nr:septum formation initiator family protein [Sporolactobacillus shoreae]TGA96534.1 DivIC [Sporolactobacillus shoreae]
MSQAEQQRVMHLRTEYVQSQEIAGKRKMKHRRGLIRRLIAFAVIVGAVCAFMLSSLASQGHQLNSALGQKAVLEKQLSASEQNAAQLKKHIQLLHDNNYIGEIVRRDYLLSKKGEIIFSKSGKSEH